MPNSTKPSPTFLTHLSSFTSPSHPHLITLTSSLKSSLSLGLNFPASVILTIGLRILYSPSWLLLSPPNLHTLRKNYTQLENARLTQSSYSRSDLQALVPKDAGWVDRAHVLGLWTLAADTKTGKVRREDVEEFQKGTLMERLKERRKRRDRGSENVLPFWRGGPGSVRGHSWVVGRALGVRVYEE
ncbi:MAG: hypothetical protein M1820_006367 [Bogoriella megaspora]|nr:MAG: hypothetical protein M1820_006367 [Bogoriella megaspora]